MAEQQTNSDVREDFYLLTWNLGVCSEEKCTDFLPGLIDGEPMLKTSDVLIPQETISKEGFTCQARRRVEGAGHFFQSQVGAAEEDLCRSRPVCSGTTRGRSLPTTGDC